MCEKTKNGYAMRCGDGAGGGWCVAVVGSYSNRKASEEKSHKKGRNNKNDNDTEDANEQNMGKNCNELLLMRCIKSVNVNANFTVARK